MEEKTEVIGEIRSGNIRIAINQFGKSTLLDIRKYFKTEEGQLAPTKKGISLTKEQFIEILEILNQKKEDISKLL
jgi:hypothetical protein